MITVIKASDPSIIDFTRYGDFNVIQATGSGMTVFGLVDMYKSYLRETEKNNRR